MSQVVVIGRPVQGRHPIGLGSIHVGALFQQRAHAGPIHLPRRVCERRRTGCLQADCRQDQDDRLERKQLIDLALAVREGIHPHTHALEQRQVQVGQRRWLAYLM